MATWRASVCSCAFFWTLLLTHFKGTQAYLQAYGCDEGWTNFDEHCYTIIAMTIAADRARDECRTLGSSVSSVWSSQEREFIMSLWRFPENEVGFLWLGLRGTSSSDWIYDDKSTFLLKINGSDWSILLGVSGVPADTTNKCVALRNGGGIAFLDCDMDANAFVCKKALPKVFITASLLNHSAPVTMNPMGHVQLFERMYPPFFTGLPEYSSRLAEATVITEVGCAFRCFSVTGCQVFQVSCETSQNCETFHCVLFSHFTS